MIYFLLLLPLPVVLDEVAEGDGEEVVGVIGSPSIGINRSINSRNVVRLLLLLMVYNGLIDEKLIMAGMVENLFTWW